MAEIQKEGYEELKNYISARTGMDMVDEMREVYERKILARVKELKLRSIKDYYFYLKYDKRGEEEFEKLIDIIIPKETYFFREERQLSAFVFEALPEVMEYNQKMKTRHIRIWCAGCSTGEEAYTLAILLNEYGEIGKWDIKIIATDINPEAIKKAREGIYGESSFRNTKSIYKTLYFERVGNGVFRIKDDIKKMVTFAKKNILDTDFSFFHEKFDIIFCRNVLIYFDREAKKKAAENFYHALREEGFLFLGHAESLINVFPLFKIRHFKNDLVYQKPSLKND
jgi:chemotaxis protein methyltransferase CheR